MPTTRTACHSPSALPSLLSLPHQDGALRDGECCPPPAKRARAMPSQQRAIAGEYGDRDAITLDMLPDDLVLSILAALSSSASRPLDVINASLTCKRLQRLTSHPLVLANASAATMRASAARWCAGAHLFLSRCKEAGNRDAGYTLGMIRFYCLGDKAGGLEALAMAAAASLPAALYSLAIIQFNGSGGSREVKNLEVGVRLCAKAAALYHVDAMRELGHCLQDGYGVRKNVQAGRRLILEANAHEAAEVLAQYKAATWLVCSQRVTTAHCACCTCTHDGHIERAAVHISHYLCQHPLYRILQSRGCSLLSDFGCNVPPPALHPAHEFMVEWFQLQPLAEGLRLCSYPMCGRPETRKHEFRRCSACASVGYCSRACQALDWKLRHKLICSASCHPMVIHGRVAVHQRRT